MTGKDETATAVLDEEIVREILEGESADPGRESRLVRLKRREPEQGMGDETSEQD